MSISDYLMNYPQAPKLKTNYAANALQNLQGNPFAGLAAAILTPFAAKTDRENEQALQQYAQEAGLAQTLRDWNREDAVAQRNRGWALEDAQTARENKTADMLERYAREDALAQRNRDWALQDRSAQWERQDRLAADNAAADALEKYAAEQAQKAQEEQSRATALRGLEELQGIADRDSIGAFTRFANSINAVSDETRQDLGKISGAVAAIAPMAISSLKAAGVSGVNSLPEFMTYVGLPENPTSREIAGALPIIRNTLGLNPTEADQNKLDGYNKKYGL